MTAITARELEMQMPDARKLEFAGFRIANCAIFLAVNNTLITYATKREGRAFPIASAIINQL